MKRIAILALIILASFATAALAQPVPVQTETQIAGFHVRALRQLLDRIDGSWNQRETSANCGVTFGHVQAVDQGQRLAGEDYWNCLLNRYRQVTNPQQREIVAAMMGFKADPLDWAALDTLVNRPATTDTVFLALDLSSVVVRIPTQWLRALENDLISGDVAGAERKLAIMAGQTVAPAALSDYAQVRNWWGRVTTDPSGVLAEITALLSND